MSKKYIDRIDLHIDYQIMMKTESHHDHKIIKDPNDIIRWEKQETHLYKEVSDEARSFGINISNWLSKMYTKNDEVYRECYRCIGTSLSSYYDTFYWFPNNTLAGCYQPPSMTPQVGSVWEYKDPLNITVKSVNLSTTNDVLDGTVTYTNRYGSNDVKTIRQFNKDYVITK
jgi:hypothetical protein